MCSWTEFTKYFTRPFPIGILSSVSNSILMRNSATSMRSCLCRLIGLSSPEWKRTESGGWSPDFGRKSIKLIHPSLSILWIDCISSTRSATIDSSTLGYGRSTIGADSDRGSIRGSLAFIALPVAKLGRHNKRNCNAHSCGGVPEMRRFNTRFSLSGTGSNVR